MHISRVSKSTAHLECLDQNEFDFLVELVTYNYFSIVYISCVLFELFSLLRINENHLSYDWIKKNK